MLTFDKVRLSRDAFSLTADLSVDRGARIAVLGPSGGGKSTLLGLVAGFAAPTSGRVFWDGQDQTSKRPGERPVSIVFQDSNLFPHLTIAQNVGMGINPNLRLSRSEEARVSEVLAETGIAEHATRKPGALSGGQRARAALARVLLRARPILLLDEAFSALGPALKAEMFELLERTIPYETVVLMVTHDPEEALRMRDVIVVDDGRVDPPQPAGTLFANPPEALARYLGK